MIPKVKYKKTTRASESNQDQMYTDDIICQLHCFQLVKF